MKSTTKALLVVAAAGTGFLVMQLLLYLHKSLELTPEQKQAQLEQTVANVKASLPRKVHPSVTWFDVKAKDMTLIYRYKIHAPRSQVLSRRSHVEKDMKKNTVVWLASLALPSGVDVKAELYDEDQVFVYSVDVN